MLHPNKRGRPKGSARKNSSDETKLPGDITFPLTSFSLTVTKNKGDIRYQLLPIIADFVNEFCRRGGKTSENFEIINNNVNYLLIRCCIYRGW